MTSVKRKTKMLELPFESYEYLQRIGWEQRTDKPYLESFTEKHRHNFDYVTRGRHGYYAHDGAFGGCNGEKRNAWEEGRWTSWSVEDMKRILDKAGLPYKDAGETEVIDVYI